MPFFENNSARIHYEDTGNGPEAVFATHGLIENTTYWSKTGITPALAESFRVISMDLRAHGKTTENEPRGYDIDTCMDDIEALAYHLGIKKFHLISHSTGGFIAVNLAMKSCKRIASLTLTDTASTTTFIEDPVQNKTFHEKFAQSFENTTWENIVDNIKKQPFPFFTGIAESGDNSLWEKAYEIVKIGDRSAIAEFVRSFYTDPDPKIEKLRQITCPTLILVGEKDDLFIESSHLMEKEIPDARLKVYEGSGHMLAIERPEELARDIKSFILSHSEKRPA